MRFILRWPKELRAQLRAVVEVLAESPAPMTAEALGERFTARGPWKRRLPQILETLEAIGQARKVDAGYAAIR